MNEAEYRNLLKRRAWDTITTLGLGIGGMMAWFGIVIATGQQGVIWVLPAILFFLGPIVVVGRRLDQADYRCSHCGNDVSARYEYVLTTRHCPSCSHRYLNDGRERPPAILSRLRQIRQAKFLRRWLWAWPGMFAIVATFASVDPAGIRK